MTLKSLTYTSLASLDLTGADVDAILAKARELNALDGITGLLVFNGTRFLQIIEGSPPAIDDLVNRLRRDPRHSAFEIRDEREIEDRMFADWSMELVRVSTDRIDARETVSRQLPDAVPDDVHQRLVTMTENISGNIDMRS
ncbi:BLUF domain-containing protein [Sphingomonas piscis]|uniref:BLUF domain-containing protein n=1 Tax=Sphingomonas piscis TaxID=2714943 RepID=A0A6G7YLK6_9SPHN|nr:BLUF domain-containing protein [Sphingomonas piscis]QIK77624.1 BLUF domain-containing protein [Sphingomonas piscis]